MASIPLQFSKRIDWSLIVTTIVVSLLVASATVTRSKPLFLAIAVLCALPAGIIFFKHRALIFWALLITSLFNDHLSLPVGGMNIRPYSALSPFAVGALMLSMTFDKSHYVCRMAPTMLRRCLPLILLLISKCVTVLALSDYPPGMGRSFIIKYVVFSGLLFATSFVIATHASSRERLTKALQVWIHLGNIVAIVAFYQLVASNTIGAHYVHHRSIIWFGRPYSVFREPDVLGSFYASIIMIVIPLLVARYHLLPRRYLWATLGLHSLGITTLFVRASWVALVGCGAVWVLSLIKIRSLASAKQYFHKGMIGVALLVGLLVVLSPSFIATLSDRFLSLTKPKNEGASEYRMRELTAMVYKTSQVRNPETLLLGHGDFSWSYWAPALLGENYDRTAVEAQAKTGKTLIHAGFCMPMTILFDNGFIGVVLFSIFLCVLTARYWRTLSIGSKQDKALIMATFLPVLAILICFVFSYDPISPFLWVMIGLHLAAVYHVEQSSKERAYE